MWCLLKRERAWRTHITLCCWQGDIYLLLPVRAPPLEQCRSSQDLTILQAQKGQIQQDGWEPAKGSSRSQAPSPQRDAATGSAWNSPRTELSPRAGNFC